MINIIKASFEKNYSIKLWFSDGSFGVMDFSYIVKKNTVLTKALKDKVYFKQFFIDFGALCWKNGLELSAQSLYLKLKQKNSLYLSEDVA